MLITNLTTTNAIKRITQELESIGDDTDAWNIVKDADTNGQAYFANGYLTRKDSSTYYHRFDLYIYI